MSFLFAAGAFFAASALQGVKVVPLAEFLPQAGLVQPAAAPGGSRSRSAQVRVLSDSESLVYSVALADEDYGCVEASLSLNGKAPRQLKVVSLKRSERSTEVTMSSKGVEAVFDVSCWSKENAFLVRLKSVKNTSAVPCRLDRVEFDAKSPFSAIDLDEASPVARNRPQRASWCSEDGWWFGAVSTCAMLHEMRYAAPAAGEKRRGLVALFPKAEIGAGEVREFGEDEAWVLYMYGRDGRYGWRERTDHLPIYPEGNPRAILAERREILHEIGGRAVHRGSVAVDRSLLRPVSDAAVRSRLDANVADKVLELDLSHFGIAPKPAFTKELISFSSHSDGELARLPPLLFADGRPMRISRWPNRGWAEVDAIIGEGTYSRGAYCDPPQSEASKTKLPVFRYSGDRPERWLNAPQVVLHGFWGYDWTDSYARAGKIDIAAKTIELAHNLEFGLKEGNPSRRRWRAINLVEEIDEPGEYAVDQQAAKMYILPPEGDVARYSISFNVSRPLFQPSGLCDVEFRNIVFEESSGMAVVMENCTNVVFRNCTFRGLLREAVVMGKGCRDCALVDCTVEDIGTHAIAVRCGDNATLERGDNAIEGCRISRCGRYPFVNVFAIELRGVGNSVRGCDISDLACGAIEASGNFMAVERNVISNVCCEVDDGGAYYQGRGPFLRGNEFRWNLWVDVGSKMGQGTCAVYFDDGDCGNLVAHDRFVRCGHPGRAGFGAVMSHGGYGNYVRDCEFVDCIRPFGSSPWNDERWLKYMNGDSYIQSLITRVRPFDAFYLSVYPSLANWRSTVKIADRRNYAIDCSVSGSPLWRTTVVPGELKPGILCGNWQTNNVSVVNARTWAEGLELMGRHIDRRLEDMGAR